MMLFTLRFLCNILMRINRLLPHQSPREPFLHRVSTMAYFTRTSIRHHKEWVRNQPVRTCKIHYSVSKYSVGLLVPYLNPVCLDECSTTTVLTVVPYSRFRRLELINFSLFLIFLYKTIRSSLASFITPPTFTLIKKLVTDSQKITPQNIYR